MDASDVGRQNHFKGLASVGCPKGQFLHSFLSPSFPPSSFPEFPLNSDVVGFGKFWRLVRDIYGYFANAE